MKKVDTVKILVSVDGHGVGGTVVMDTEHTKAEWDCLSDNEKELVAHEVYSENVSWGWHVATPEEEREYW